MFYKSLGNFALWGKNRIIIVVVVVIIIFFLYDTFIRVFRP